MKKIVLFDPSYGTSNLGDFIINEAIMREMKFLFSSNYLARYSTHTPLMHLHQLLKKNPISKSCAPEHLKFLGGSNIFKHDLFKYTLDWNINIFTKDLYRNSVSLGGGCQGNPITTNAYTKFIYKSILSKEYIHSTRDEKTKAFLESLGFKAVNTGCPTLWGLSSEFCKSIPTKKSKDVVFTLTEYLDSSNDQKLVDTLTKSYRNVYFWIQGSEDLKYLRTLKNTESIKLVSPNLEAYKEVLMQGDVDYVGTRLHAGIYAMQHKVRSIILIVDNRARDMQNTYNINAIERDSINNLEQMIQSEFATNIKVDQKKIEEWKSQFAHYEGNA